MLGQGWYFWGVQLCPFHFWQATGLNRDQALRDLSQAAALMRERVII